jgi:hypothetical protein
MPALLYETLTLIRAGWRIFHFMGLGDTSISKYRVSLPSFERRE